ncbi:MAG TPA: hypothetical protein VMT43_12600 [Acidimicrobiales bacterium]|nr:hypothetical protein [Acidimicrobiales bacterium]
MAKASAVSKRKGKPPLRIVSRMIGGHLAHWYECDGVSQSGRGVTTILGNGLPAPALIKWTGNTVADCALDEGDIWRPLAQRDRAAAYDYLRNAADRDRDQAANRGTEVHGYAERMANGEEVEPPDELLGHVDAYIEWAELWQPEIVAVEMVGANWTHRYFGRFDLLVKVKGWWAEDTPKDALLLVDIKTSRSGPFPKDALQLTAYRHFEQVAVPDDDGNCWDLEPMPEVDGCCVLQLAAGSHQFVPVNPDLDRALFAQFLHTLRTAEFLGSGWGAKKTGWDQDSLLPARLEPHQPF